VCIAFLMETFVFGMGWYEIVSTSRGKCSIVKDLALLKIRSPAHTKKS